MPKARSTCTRCSMKRQKCDRATPCSRCVANNEAHLCTTQWTHGYDPAVHRKYPRKSLASQLQPSTQADGNALAAASLPDATTTTTPSWSSRSASEQSLPVRSQVTGGEEGRGGEEGPGAEVNRVDFITYGRSEVADIGIDSLLKGKEAYREKEALMNGGLTQGRVRSAANEIGVGSLSLAAQEVEAEYLQSLLPTRQQVFLLVDYHDRCMNYWTGATYHAPTFRKALQEAYADSDTLDLRAHDWRWSALLFSILSGAVIGSPEATSAAWGFTNADKLKLARAWGNAQKACLYLGNYASRHHIYSVQSILNMHTSEHLVGSTKEWALYSAAAIVIARGLGLHKLGPHPDDALPHHQLTPTQHSALITREIGRRVWLALTSQDWLCSTSQGVYTLHKRYFSTIAPGHFDEATMHRVSSPAVPTVTFISTYVNELAHTLIRFLDAMLDAPDLPAKYAVVLRFDAQMRALAIERRPPFLDPRTPIQPGWPVWVPWARRSYEASASHKIIMVHQAFLARSFKDPRYTYSRWACVSAAKTILGNFERRMPEEPQWWVEQAFVVTAGLCLGLDLFHRGVNERGVGDAEAVEHWALLERAVGILGEWPTSSVAAHGTRLLMSLLGELERKAEGERNGAPAEDVEFPHNMAPQALAAEASEKPVEAAVSQPQQQGDLFPGEAWGNMDFDVDMLAFEEFLGGLPMQGGLDGGALF